MKGLKIIPMFLILIILSYFGLWFVESNRTEVIIHLGTQETPPTPLGFAILTSILIGMVIAGVFCSIEMLALYIQNRKLKRQIPKPDESLDKTDKPVENELTPRTSGRFT